VNMSSPKMGWIRHSLARIRTTVVIAGAASLLAACSTIADLSAANDPATFNGRIAVFIPATTERLAQQENASFELGGTSEKGYFLLISPLGTVMADARWDSDSATLRTRDGERSYRDMDDMTKKALGEPVPLDAMLSWLKGRPWYQASSDKTAKGFAQLDWEVDTTQLASQGRLNAKHIKAPIMSLSVLLDR
jgi:outer membrane lipoprotein LolB